MNTLPSGGEVDLSCIRGGDGDSVRPRERLRCAVEIAPCDEVGRVSKEKSSNNPACCRLGDGAVPLRVSKLDAAHPGVHPPDENGHASDNTRPIIAPDTAPRPGEPACSRNNSLDHWPASCFHGTRVCTDTEPCIPAPDEPGLCDEDDDAMPIRDA